AEEALLHAHLAVTGASGAGGRRGARLGAGTVAGIALVPGWHADRGVETVCGLLQRDVQVVAQVGAAIHLRTGTATATAATEDVAKDIAEGIAKAAETGAASAAHIR